MQFPYYYCWYVRVKRQTGDNRESQLTCILLQLKTHGRIYELFLINFSFTKTILRSDWSSFIRSLKVLNIGIQI